MTAFQKIGKGFTLAAAGSLVLLAIGAVADVEVLTLLGGILASTFLLIGVTFLILQARLFGNPAELERVLIEGMPAQATLNEVGGTAGRVGANPIMKLDLTVNLQSVVLRTVVPVQHVHRLQPGAPLPVKVDPNDTTRCVVDWDALTQASR